MPRNIAIIVGVGAVAVVGVVIIFFDSDVNRNNSSDLLPSPDSGEYEDNQGPDSGDDYDAGPLGGPDSGEEEGNQGPDSGEEIDLNEPTGPDSGEEEDNQGPDSGEEIDLNEPTSPDSGEDISLNDDLKNRAKGSCNLISEGSTCVEYIGSYWTESTAKMNCSNASAFSTKACPRPALGGCRIGADTSNEIVTWHYGYGGDPYTEVISYAAGACRALPSGWWVQ